MNEQDRQQRLQVMLTEEELKALDSWRFDKHMPSRAAAVRELLRRGLAAEGFMQAPTGSRSKDFGVMEPDAELPDELALGGRPAEPGEDAPVDQQQPDEDARHADDVNRQD